MRAAPHGFLRSTVPEAAGHRCPHDRRQLRLRRCSTYSLAVPGAFVPSCPI